MGSVVRTRTFFATALIALSACVLLVRYVPTGPVCDFLSTHTDPYTCSHALYTLVAPGLLPCWPAAFFALVTYFMRESVFRRWHRWTLFVLPVSILLIWAGSNDGSGEGAWFIQFTNGFFYLLFTGLIYVLVSIGIIISTYFLEWRRSRAVRARV